MPNLLLSAVWLGLLVSQTVESAETQKIPLATAEWEPYISETKPGHGKFAEIVSAVFKEIKMETEFVFAPWKRSEALVKNGEAFAAIPYSYTAERAKIYNYSAPLMNSPGVFFYLKKAYPKGISYSKLEELARYRIGGVTGYWYESLFADALLKVEYVVTDEQSIKKLYFQRVDLIATDEEVGWALIKKLYPKEEAAFAVVKKPFAITQLHLMVSKKYPHAAEITARFNAALKKIQEKNVLPSSL